MKEYHKLFNEGKMLDSLRAWYAMPEDERIGELKYIVDFMNEKRRANPHNYRIDLQPSDFFSCERDYMFECENYVPIHTLGAALWSTDLEKILATSERLVKQDVNLHKDRSHLKSIYKLGNKIDVSFDIIDLPDAENILTAKLSTDELRTLAKEIVPRLDLSPNEKEYFRLGFTIAAKCIDFIIDPEIRPYCLHDIADMPRYNFEGILANIIDFDVPVSSKYFELVYKEKPGLARPDLIMEFVGAPVGFYYLTLLENAAENPEQNNLVQKGMDYLSLEPFCEGIKHYLKTEELYCRQFNWDRGSRMPVVVATGSEAIAAKKKEFQDIITKLTEHAQKTGRELPKHDWDI